MEGEAHVKAAPLRPARFITQGPGLLSLKQRGHAYTTRHPQDFVALPGVLTISYDPGRSTSTFDISG